MSYLYSALHDNRIDVRILSSRLVGIGPPIQDGRSYSCAGLNAGLNLSSAMIQENDGVAALVGQELVFPRFEQA
jgi:hypothetical protein